MHADAKINLRVLFLLLGDQRTASSRVRGFWIADELSNLGVKCTVVYGEDRASYFRCLRKLPWHDILFVQKRCSRWDYHIINFARLMGKGVVFDLDDAYSKVKSDITLRNVSRIMKRSSAVTVGSQNLLEFAKQYQENSHYLPSSIKLENYELPAQKHENSRVCLGWIGNGAHYHIDLVQILRGPLMEIALKHNVRLKLVGVCKQKELYKAFSNIPGLETTFIDSIDWADHAEVRKAMLDFDIGLYPVLDNDFNRYKCAFKALEYMALGIAVVASPVGANAYVVSDGMDGFHANEKKEWINALSILITDQTARKKMGRAGRLKVETQYSISESAKKLAEIMAVAIDKTRRLQK
jgi:glycosyltransferase involved in cell wall biosynthesis